MRLDGSACIKSGSHTAIYSGRENLAKSCVGLIISERISRTLVGYVAIFDRFGYTKFSTSPFAAFPHFRYEFNTITIDIYVQVCTFLDRMTTDCCFKTC